MQVAAPALFNGASQLELQSARGRRLNRSNTPVQERSDAPEDYVSGGTVRQKRSGGFDLPDKLGDIGRIHFALTSALKTNRSIENQYLFDTIR